ncbi:MAG TPA: DUF480 domain-containing protein [Mesorhizobium sp.]
MTDTDLPHLTPVEARILGCLLEKQLLTPDVYPLTLNALQSAANQKTSREPVMALEQVDINRTLKSLEEKGLARRMMASRADRYEQMASRKFSLTTPQSALLAMLLLRGPQTLNELHTRTDRMANFGSADAVRTELDMLTSKHPPLAQEIGRGPGQREDRYGHLLTGPIDIAALAAVHAPIATSASAPGTPAAAGMEARIATLEEQVAKLTARLDDLGG